MKRMFAILSLATAVGASQAQQPPVPAPHVIPAPTLSLFGHGANYRPHTARFIQGDPADSLYQLAHDLLARGDYGRSARLFKDIAQKYPRSAYQDELPYYEAWARYRIGSIEELENAARLLEPRASKLIGVVSASNASTPVVSGRRRASDGDVIGLYIRVNQALAQRGNRRASEIIENITRSGGNICDADEMQIRRGAMNALSQMNPTQALPILKTVLDKKDECNAGLRRSAVFILGGRGDSEAASLIAATAKNDPSATVRAEAINWLPKLQGDAGVRTLEEILRTERDESMQQSIIQALTASDNPRARSSMRALIDRKDAPLNLRIEAISAFNNERATSDDAAYFRTLYSRADSDRLKEAIINTISRIGGQENEQWVLNLAKNQNEPSQLRAVAISRLLRTNIALGDLIKLYDASDSYNIRTRLVSALEVRKESEAADKLYDIVRNGTVDRIRVQALAALTRRKDPRSVELLSHIIEGRKP